MIRTSLKLMMVFNTRNRFAKQLRAWIDRKTRNKEFFVDLGAIDDKALMSKRGTSKLTETVEKTLDEAEAAVVILSQDDAVSARNRYGKKVYHPRPNVSYEIGYLVARLGYKCVELLVDSRRNWLPDQPSNLIDAYKKRCPDSRRAHEIVETLLTTLGVTAKAHWNWGKEINFESLRQFNTLLSYSEWVKAQLESARRKKAVGVGWKLLLEHAQLLVDELGAATGREIQLKLGNGGVRDVEALQASNMFEAMLLFWSAHYAGLRRKLLQRIRQHLDKVAPQDRWLRKISVPLIRVLYCDYRGLVSESSGRQDAAHWYKEAKREAEKLEGDLRELWLGYVNFNLARVLREPERVQERYEEACVHRKAILEKAKGTVFEEGRQSELVIAVGMYLRWLIEQKKQRLVGNLLGTYRPYLDSFLNDPSAPRSYQQALARVSLLGEKQEIVLLKRSNCSVPPQARALSTAAIEYHKSAGPILAAAFGEQILKRRKRGYSKR